MPRFHFLLWGARPIRHDAESWGRWIAPMLGTGVVQAAGSFRSRRAALDRSGGVTTVAEPEAGDDAPSGFLLIEAENMAAAIALAASGPERLAARVEIHALDPSTEATRAAGSPRAEGAA